MEHKTIKWWPHGTYNLPSGLITVVITNHWNKECQIFMLITHEHTYIYRMQQYTYARNKEHLYFEVVPGKFNTVEICRFNNEHYAYNFITTSIGPLHI
jgi:hypothetical protein